jgi:type II secretory pathway pseudopilin PulG
LEDISNRSPPENLSMSRTSVSVPNRIRKQISGRRQGGYLLIELGLVLIVSTILLAGQFSRIVEAIDTSNANSTALYLNEVQGAVNRYIEENLQALKIGNSVVGFAYPTRPSITELKSSPAHYLDARVAATTALGLQFNVALTQDPACAGDPTNVGCVIAGVVYSTSGYREQGGQIRTDVLASALTTLGQDGAMSYAEAPGLLRFQGGATMANPAGNTAGVLAIRVGNGSGLTGLLNPYYRLDGTKPLSGNMNAANNDINGIKNLQVAGQAAIATLEVTGNTKLDSSSTPGTACLTDGSMQRNTNGTGLVVCSSGTWQQVGNVVAGIGEGVPCSMPGQLGSNATGISFICNGSVWSSVNTTAALNGVCAPDGKMAMTVTRDQLVCKNGSYVRLLNLLNKSVEVSRVLVTDGSTVNKPSCDAGGTAAYSFQLTQTVVDVAVTPPRQAMYVAATDNVTSWGVKIKVKDNTGAEFTANTYSISAVMKLECAY